MCFAEKAKSLQGPGKLNLTFPFPKEDNESASFDGFDVRAKY